MKYILVLIIVMLFSSCQKEESIEPADQITLSQISFFNQKLQGTTTRTYIYGEVTNVVWTFTITDQQGRQQTYTSEGSEGEITVDLHKYTLSITVCYNNIKRIRKCLDR